MLDEQEHIPGVKRQDLYTTVTGINHFTWITSASYQGMDLMPLYARFVEEHPEGIQLGSDNWMNSHFACAHKVKFDLFQRYGAIAAAATAIWWNSCRSGICTARRQRTSGNLT